MMNTIFREEVRQGWLSVYMDNLAIHTARFPHKTEEEHLNRHRQLVHKILDRLKEHDLYLKPEKCDFKQPQVEYLGVVVGKG